MISASKIAIHLLSFIFFLTYYSLPLVKVAGVNLKIILAFLLAFLMFFGLLFSCSNFKYLIKAFFGFSYTAKAVFLLIFYKILLHLFHLQPPPIYELLTTQILSLCYFFIAATYILYAGAKWYVIISSFAVAPTLLVALGQLLGVDFFWNIRYSFGVDTTQDYSATLIFRTDAVGLDLFSIPLSYKIVTLLFFYSFWKVQTGRLSVSGVMPASLLSILSSTRSVLLASVVAFLTLKMSIRGKIISLAFLFAIVALLIWGGRGGWFINGSSVGRFYLFYSGVDVFFKNPFGITGNYFDYVDSMNPAVTSLVNDFVRLDSSWAEKFTPHNFLINTALGFGVFGLIMSLWLAINLVRRTPTVNGVNLASLYLLIIFINGSFHNAGFLYNDFDFMFGVALLEVFIFKRMHKEYGKI